MSIWTCATIDYLATKLQTIADRHGRQRLSSADTAVLTVPSICSAPWVVKRFLFQHTGMEQSAVESDVIAGIRHRQKNFELFPAQYSFYIFEIGLFFICSLEVYMSMEFRKVKVYFDTVDDCQSPKRKTLLT